MNEATYFWKQISQYKADDSRDIKQLYAIFEELIYQLTESINLNFSTFYVRLSYVFHSYPIPKQLQRRLYQLRGLLKNQVLESSEIAGYNNDDWNQFHYAVIKFISIVLNIEIPEDLKFREESFPSLTKESEKYYSHLKLVIQNIDYKNNLLNGTSENLPGEILTIEPQDLENYIEIFESKDFLQPPFSVSLINSTQLPNGHYAPELIIIEPDYLIDVTTVSEAAADKENLVYHIITKKFINQPITSKLLEGHAANLFLDNLIKDPNAGFKEIFIQLFHAYPLVLAKFDDTDLKELHENCKHHYTTLKWVLSKEFPKHDIEPDGIFIEPSFISPKYGIQGRLDIYYKGEKKNQAIVELKSGKPFKENKYGLSRSHYFQTLLYDLLVKSVTKSDLNPSCFILYSKLGEHGLKYAPPIKSMQHEALIVRNKIYLIEKQLTSPGYLEKIISGLNENDQNINGFLRNNWLFFKNVLLNLDPASKSYFYHCVAFIAREHQIAKTGNNQLDRLSGQSSVWLEPTSKKEENFSILKDLNIREVKLSSDEPLVVLFKSQKTNKLANFRVGDIVILYPGKTQNPTEYQIFKCTLIELSGDKIVLRLRSTQLNSKVFFDHKVWNIEPDLLDSSFNGLNRSIFEFIHSSENIRNKILGIIAPDSTNQIFSPPEYLIESQADIYQGALQATDYYLIWGPPGTGKTSQLVKALATHYYKFSERPILLAAYTNRAADEICEAIENIAENIKDHYVRIGARYSTGMNYREKLLENKLKTCTHRNDVLEVLQKQKIVVGTLASISGKPELFEYFNFCCGIVDEASQVLEPMMAGLMSKLPKTILIGDHKQLPSIVTQSEMDSRVLENTLTGLGFENLADSLFERLFKRCQTKNWTNAFGMLTHQGRMNPEMVNFPNEMFYNFQLKSIELPHKVDAFEILQNKIGSDNIYFRQRISFINCDVLPDETHLKTNSTEASHVLNLIKLINSNQNENNPFSVGIITPFRAQIAFLKSKIDDLEFDSTHLTIDTVERYQGGARDIILVSLCANKKPSLKSITSINKEGIDRKLNVALTRARSQIIILGNKTILENDQTYKQLISRYEVQLD